MGNSMINYPKFDRRSIGPLNQVRTRDDEGNPIIEGYFVVFDGVYQMTPDMSESVDRHAFDDTINGDIRILIDHETRLVVGRTSAGTAQIRVDEYGVWGHADINPNDTDAMNAHARVERGDVNQGSFGFEILEEETDFRDDGSIHFTIKKVRLHELSIVTFPAYEDTTISARAKQADELRQKANKAWKERMMKKLKKEGE